MGRITGLGGVFIKARDPKALAAWYEQHLGIAFGKSTYISFPTSAEDGTPIAGSNVLSFSSANSDYFAPSTKEAMLNLRVEGLFELLDKLRGEGVTLVGDPVNESYGKFAWLIDPEGNKIELWEP